MEDSKSINNYDDGDHFFDALDEFPFYDCLDIDDPDQSISPSSSISQLEPIELNANESLKPNPSPEISSPTGLRRRRSLSQRIRRDASGNGSKNPIPNSAVSSEANLIHDDATTSDATATPRERKFRFSKENEAESENSDSFKVRFNSGGVSRSVNEQNSAITIANNEIINDSASVDSRPVQIDDSSSNFLFSLAGLVIKAIGFQLNLLISFFTFPIRLLYSSYLFVIDPFRIVRHGREYLTRRLLGVWDIIYASVWRHIGEWLKEHKSTWKFALRFGWGLLLSIYVCLVLVTLLVSAFVVSGFVMRFLVVEPIRMKETLNLDYTKDSPVALVPLISCPDAYCGVNCGDKIEVGKLREPRVVPPNHKLRVTVSLTLPESDYNRNLGIFQVRVDFLSANGNAIASSRHPCMLQFKSPPIRLLLTFLKVAPLVAGYLSESQTLNINFRGFTEGDIPTSCLRVTIEQRAEYRPGAGIPEIYASFLTLESELPLIKRVLWYWKKTVYIWTSMIIFITELVFTLICCKPIIMPRVRLRNGSARTNASQSDHPVQRQPRP